METIHFEFANRDQIKNTVIPAKAGTHCHESRAFDNTIAEPRVDSRLRGNDNRMVARVLYA
jgi:hypothetical protein